MNRRDFLITFWNKILFPIVLLVLICYFYFGITQQDSSASWFSLLTLQVGLLLNFLQLISHLLISGVANLKTSIPKTLKVWTDFLYWLTKYISPPIIALVCISLWQDDAIIAAIIMSFLLLHQLSYSFGSFWIKFRKLFQ